MATKIVIVGGVAGGASAAAKARRTNESANITIFEKGPYVSFANCGLPYYVGETIQDRDELLLQTPERFWKRFRVQVYVLHEVLQIDRAIKCVHVKNVLSGEVTSHPYEQISSSARSRGHCAEHFWHSSQEYFFGQNRS